VIRLKKGGRIESFRRSFSGTGSGTYVSLARLRQITLSYGEPCIYAYAQLRRIALIYHRFTVFAANSKSAEGNLVGVRPPLPAPR
jgi:hypothetical protein